MEEVSANFPVVGQFHAGSELCSRLSILGRVRLYAIVAQFVLLTGIAGTITSQKGTLVYSHVQAKYRRAHQWKLSRAKTN